MGDDSKAVFNLNYEDMDILEMYNSKKWHKFTAPKNNWGPKVWLWPKSTKTMKIWFLWAATDKGINETWICYSFDCLIKSNIIIHSKSIQQKSKLKYLETNHIFHRDSELEQINEEMEKFFDYRQAKSTKRNTA